MNSEPSRLFRNEPAVWAANFTADHGNIFAKPPLPTDSYGIVMEATAGRQEPYTYSSPGKEDFFFVAAK